MNFSFKKNSGFTLIELMIAIVIIAILFSLTTVAFANARSKGADNKRKQTVASIKAAMNLYFQDKGKYPCAGATGTEVCSYFPSTSLTILTSASTNYIKQLPQDSKMPVPACGYVVSVNANASAYTIFTSLDNTNDTDAKNPKPAILVPPLGVGSSDGNITYRMPGAGICTGVAYLYNYWVNSD